MDAAMSRTTVLLESCIPPCKLRELKLKTSCQTGFARGFGLPTFSASCSNLLNKVSIVDYVETNKFIIYSYQFLGQIILSCLVGNPNVECTSVIRSV